MGLPQSPPISPPHLYPQALQLKLYQAFIFSIPILFSIILFLLFYLFYLKKRASSLSSPPPALPVSSNRAPPYVSSVGLKGELKDKLPVVLFDEELGAKDSQCCVCLGEFEMKEKLLQVPSCKHVFHIDCIHHWLHSNATCPLCRCSVIPAAAAAKSHGSPQPHQDGQSSSDPAQALIRSDLEQPQQHRQEHVTVPVQGPSSSGDACPGDSQSVIVNVQALETLRSMI